MRGVSVAPIADRLADLSIPEPNTGCLLWCGVVKKNGYGTIGVKVDGRWQTKHAHRVAYEATVGPIDPGFDLDHKCRNRACINPDHLEPVTRSVNLSRSPLMNRQENKTHCPRGHVYSGTNSRGQRICRECLRLAQQRHRSKQ